MTGGEEDERMLCISVFMSFGLCVFRGDDNYDPCLLLELLTPGSLNIDVSFPGPAVTGTVSKCICVLCGCVWVFKFPSTLPTFPPFQFYFFLKLRVRVKGGF